MISGIGMATNLFYQPGLAEGVRFLEAEESRHLVRVLRMKAGDEVTITDGKGYFYFSLISEADPKKCRFEIVEKRFFPKRNFHVHLALAPTKNADRTEWFVEKATEIGVDEISFINCKNSERKSINLDRIKKITINAMKQSQQAWQPKVNPMTPFKEILSAKADQKLIAYVDATNPKHLQAVARPQKHYLILIGPEGDFSKTELDLALEHGFEKVSLGANRLRTETAGLVACQAVYFVNS